jgi:hypothetical protein
MTMYCQDNQNNWDEYLPHLLMAYRSSKHASTKVTYGEDYTILGRFAIQNFYLGQSITVVVFQTY